MIDNRTVNSPFDISMTENYNPYNLTHISEQIMKIFSPGGNRCAICKIELERIPPPCILTCPYYIHRGPGKTRWDSYPIIQTRRGRNPFRLSMRRSNLLFNFYHKLDFIFVGSFLNGVELDHLDGNPCNDRKENLAPALRLGENMQRGKDLHLLQKQFRELWELKVSRKMSSEKEIELDKIIIELNTLKESKFTPIFYQLLVLMEKAIKLNKILIPPRRWWNDKKTSEITDYVIKEFKENPDKYFQAF